MAYRALSPGRLYEYDAHRERCWMGDGYYDSPDRPEDQRTHMYPFTERACPPQRMLSRPRRICGDGFTPNPNYKLEMDRWLAERRQLKEVM